MSFGFKPIFDKKNNAFIVGKIYKDSDASRAGLKLNDKILSINGQDVSKIDYACYCRNNYQGKPSFLMEGDAVTLVALHDGKEKEYVFKKYPLFYPAENKPKL